MDQAGLDLLGLDSVDGIVMECGSIGLWTKLHFTGLDWTGPSCFPAHLQLQVGHPAGEGLPYEHLVECEDGKGAAPLLPPPLPRPLLPASHTSHPAPHTLHLTPHTLHLTPHKLHLTPHSLYLT